jgi:hypothetical protein
LKLGSLRLHASPGSVLAGGRSAQVGSCLKLKYNVDHMLFQLYSTVGRWSLRLNMKLDLQKFTWATVYSCTHWLRPHNPPPPPQHLGSYTRALLVRQDRRHIFVTPWPSLSGDYLIEAHKASDDLSIQDSLYERNEMKLRGLVLPTFMCL